jgi:hypothetical protein
MKATPRNSPAIPIRFGVAVVGVGYISGLVWLLFLDKIGEPAFCFLVGVLMLFVVVLLAYDRLLEFDLKNMRIVLSEAKEITDDLSVKADELRKVILPLAHLVTFTSLFAGDWDDVKTRDIKNRWIKHKLTLLENASALPHDLAQEAKKYINIYEERTELGKRQFDLASENESEQDKQEIERIRVRKNELHSKFLEMLISDTN